MWADATSIPCLPTMVDLRPGEALDGYLERVADANYLTTAHLLTQIRARTDTTRFLMLAPSPATLQTLASITGETTEHLHAATLACYDGNALDLTGLDPQRQASFRTVAARGWATGHGTQICPACLAETGTWSIAWRLPTTTVCDRHGTYLLAVCPGCRRGFRDQRHSHLRSVGATARCGNPLGAGPRNQCQLDLTTLKAPPADPECLTRHQRQDLAGSGLPVTVFGEQARPREYSATLKSLTVLLLHIASATTAPHDLPAWAAHLADGDSRSHRWALHPPADPAVRSRALTTADTILATPDIDAAADVFTTWCEKVPVTPDGRLGWLADHTRMTQTLTRLVMATHAPRRRTSRLLEAHAPMTGSLRQIPHVLPDRIFEEHLTGLFTSRDDTVRLFASLTIARTHPRIGTWADAAIALDLPPDLGTSTARACSSSQTATPKEVVAAITAAARALDGRDYRDLESQVRHLATTRRWFTQWARHHRPGTLAVSKNHAVAWLWTHVTHGHANAAPSSPEAHQHPAAARQFAASLTPDQRQSLASCIGNTAVRPTQASSHEWGDDATACNRIETELGSRTR